MFKQYPQSEADLSEVQAVVSSKTELNHRIARSRQQQQITKSNNKPESINRSVTKDEQAKQGKKCRQTSSNRQIEFNKVQAKGKCPQNKQRSTDVFVVANNSFRTP